MSFKLKATVPYLIFSVLAWGTPLAIIYFETGEPQAWEILLGCALVSYIVLSISFPYLIKTWKGASKERVLSAMLVTFIFLLSSGTLVYIDFEVLGREFSEPRIYFNMAVGGTLGVITIIILKRTSFLNPN